MDIILTRAVEGGTAEGATDATGEDADMPEDTSGDAEDSPSVDDAGSPSPEEGLDAVMTLSRRALNGRQPTSPLAPLPASAAPAEGDSAPAGDEQTDTTTDQEAGASPAE